MNAINAALVTAPISATLTFLLVRLLDRLRRRDVETQAKDILEKAEAEASTRVREAGLEAKDIVLQQKAAFDEEGFYKIGDAVEFVDPTKPQKGLLFDGRVGEDFYIPAFARRYPFVFAADENSDRLILCVDRQAPMVTNQPEVPFFENGQPTQFTNDAIEFCKEFERQRRATTDFVKMIRDLDLFEQKTVTFQPRNPDGTEAGPQQKIADYWAISEERFNALPDAKYMELKNNGAIGAIYAHMVSLLNWQRVIQRAMRIPVSPNPQPANV